MKITSLVSYLLVVLISIIFITTVFANSSEEKECVYTVYVKTGDIKNAGTDSKINLTVSDYSGESVSVGNLKDWGFMGPEHDYFERGNLDIFSGRGRCLSSSICRLNLGSDGKGVYPGWFVETVEVTMTGYGRECSKSDFFLGVWLAPKPHGQLSYDIGLCDFPFSSASK